MKVSMTSACLLGYSFGNFPICQSRWQGRLKACPQQGKKRESSDLSGQKPGSRIVGVGRAAALRLRNPFGPIGRISAGSTSVRSLATRTSLRFTVHGPQIRWLRKGISRIRDQ